jgi:hypothetical protein
MLLMRLRLYYSPCLSLNAYIYSFIKLALLAIYAITISRPVYSLSCIFLALHMRAYILSAIWVILTSIR